MTGIEKITQTIIERAEEEAAQILRRAEDRCEAVRQEAHRASEADRTVILEEAQKKAALIGHIGASGAKTEQSKTVLLARQEIISSVIEKALDRLRSQDDKSYFDTLQKLIVLHAAKGSGEILLSKKDKDRLPAGFIDRVNSALGSGRTVTLAPDSCDIDGGVILRYGGIEENCSFEALALERRESMADSLRAILFE